MQNSKLRIQTVIALVFGLFYLPAYAATADIPPAPAAIEIPAQTSMATTELSEQVKAKRDFTLRQLEEIQAETVIVEAQVLRAKAIKSLGENGAVPVTGSTTIPVNAASPGVSASANNTLPQINEIYGGSQRLIARLQLNDGSYAELTEGQNIPGTQLKITSISAREVRVSGMAAGGTQSLPFN